MLRPYESIYVRVVTMLDPLLSSARCREPSGLEGLTGGSWQLTNDELGRFLVHDSTGVRRAGCVYLARHREHDGYRNLARKHLTRLAMINQGKGK